VSLIFSQCLRDQRQQGRPHSGRGRETVRTAPYLAGL
jgi:hypothetical protein